MPITKVKVNGQWELASPQGGGGGAVDSVNGQTGTVVLDASDVGALPDSTTIPQGTVTSVRVQATSPVQSSVNTAQSTSLNTTVSLASAYGDTQNPYGSKTKNYVLAAPSNANGNPSFRALAAADIPSITKSKISDFPTNVSSFTNDAGYTSNAGTVTSVRVQATSPVSSSVSTEQSSSLNTTISLASGYGDTQNPYGSKTKNYVLAAPSNANGNPSFRALAAADIPDLSGTYLTSAPVTSVNTKTGAVSLSASDVSALPLSAGSGNALTGDLYVDIASGSAGNIFFRDSSNKVVMRMSYLSDGQFRVCSTTDNGGGSYTSDIGIGSNTSNGLILSAKNGDVILRPVSYSTTSPEAYLNSSGDWHIVGGGQQIGGHPEATASATNVSLSANSWTTVKGVTLVSSGVYLVTASLIYQPSATTGHHFTIALGTSGTNYIVGSAEYVASTGARPHTITGIITGLTTCNLLANTQSSSITGTISSATIHYVRLS